jgi:hypothetical protein
VTKGGGNLVGQVRTAVNQNQPSSRLHQTGNIGAYSIVIDASTSTYFDNNHDFSWAYNL